MFNYLNKSENSIAILFALLLVSLTIPYGFPLFTIITMFFVILKFISGRIKIRINLGILLFYISVIFYFIGILWTGFPLYAKNIGDLTNIASFFLIWLLLSDLDRESYKRLIHNIAQYTTVVIFPISLYAIYKFINLTNGIRFEFLFEDDGRYPGGTSLTADYNMFSLGIIPALIFSLYFLVQDNKKFTKIYYFLVFSSTSITILLAGSRRAWIVSVLIIIFALVVFIRYLMKKNKAQFLRIVFTTTYSLVFISLLGILFGFTDRISDSFFDSIEFQKLEKRFNTIGDGGFDTREVRYDYAFNLINEQTPLQFVVGSGFDYVGKFGERFSNPSGENFPHNPFLSSMLYSGVLGTLALIVLLIWSINQIVNRWSLIGIHFIFYYFITWMFVFISGNSIFSIRLFGVILLIIFAAPALNQTENKKLKTTQLKPIN